MSKKAVPDKSATPANNIVQENQKIERSKEDSKNGKEAAKKGKGKANVKGDDIAKKTPQAPASKASEEDVWAELGVASFKKKSKSSKVAVKATMN